MTSPSASRREFLLTATGCVAHVLLNAACAPRHTRARWTMPLNPTVTTMPFARLDAVATNAWAVVSTPLGGDRTTFANGGIIAGRTGVVVIEGFYREAGAQWLAQQARALTGRWPTHVVVSHYHVDHASGVGGYALDGARPQLHVTEETRAAALGGTPVAPARSEALSRAFADVVLTRTTGETRLDLGDRTVTLEPVRGHTASDLVVHEHDAALTYSGDLVWNGMFPNYVDARPRALHANVNRLVALVSKRHLLVPGHGAVADLAAMTRYRGLLDSLEQAARTGFAAGRSPQETAAAYVVPLSLGDWMASKTSIERAMGAWWRELGTP
ncbi:MBL fold metallo-hydrolase [Gemmatimonas phototrophica]|uniref:MBL fold metallo-hydrolase n=1 Tax=Gemmatimonas phototrophica TaxID=1379270 RepID=UPI0009ED8E64|nr:MBL fold metallo-hydrolase [Gemmatimonas phototrophica]